MMTLTGYLASGVQVGDVITDGRLNGKVTATRTDLYRASVTIFTDQGQATFGLRQALYSVLRSY